MARSTFGARSAISDNWQPAPLSAELQLCMPCIGSSPRCVLVTGATGFVGGAMSARLRREGVLVRTGVRHVCAAVPLGVQPYLVPDLNASADWSGALAGVDAVVHCAARVHVMHDQAQDPLAEFRRVNVEGTLRLAQQAAAAGVRRFVYLSSIKVNGESTAPGHAFCADDLAAPQDPYGKSKWETEQALQALAALLPMELVIVRPPLVYGPGVQANFAALMRWVQRGWPLPLAALQNRRSLVARDNLVDLLCLCLRHPAAAGQVFLVSDGEDVSTPELVRRLAQAMGRSAHLWPVPVAWLECAGALLGRRAAVQRLCSCLQVDIEKTRRLLGWQPPIGMGQGLQQAVQGEGRAIL